MTTMRPFPLPMNGPARAEGTRALGAHGGDGDPLFDEIAEIVREVFDAPIALVTLIDSDDSRFVAHMGADIATVPKDFSLCAHTFVTREPLVIPDALADPRWASQPVVVEPPNVRFYAGAPVILSGGFPIGAVCAVALEPRPAPSENQMRILGRLARVVARAHEIPIEPDAVAAAALAAAQRTAQDEFLTLVSHEMRTPLNGIMGITELLEPAEEERELVEALIHTGQHLGAVVENILTFTELRSGDMALDEREVDVDAMLGDVATSFTSLARARGRRLMRGADHAGRARADAAKLQLAVACLVSNAVMHGGGRTELIAGRDSEGRFVIDVMDHGDGIAPEAAAAAFRAFSHAGALTTRMADGLGLGLPMSQRLVRPARRRRHPAARRGTVHRPNRAAASPLALTSTPRIGRAGHAPRAGRNRRLSPLGGPLRRAQPLSWKWS